MIEAKAHAEKRLFISLLTRDISLADAFLDLLDNSINAAVKATGLQEGNAADYVALLTKPAKPRFTIQIEFDGTKVAISDDCGGISSEDASTKVFVFGAEDESHLDDRLSVYGIGLKRAMFKLGNQIDMESQHPKSIDRIHRLGLAPNVETNIYIYRTLAPMGLGCIDHSVSHRLRQKLRALQVLLDDPDLHEIAFDEENSEDPIAWDISPDDVRDLIEVLEGRASYSDEDSE
ncbi:ATP-binding protein [Mesorhizobium sp.]|uniref:ATP-binding protein n=1 Tax=Mesorhizobium sp. TaxID=1871066 RepID=UPI00257BD328|nr:ATP-binding protein [Mesorhizobium sp.]